MYYLHGQMATPFFNLQVNDESDYETFPNQLTKDPRQHLLKRGQGSYGDS